MIDSPRAVEEQVGMADYKMTGDPSIVLVAPNLGSCLGVAIYDFQKKIGAVAHFLLPSSKKNPNKALHKPYMYVDTGLINLLRLLIKSGCRKKELVIKAAGGALINSDSDIFKIGKRNYNIFRKILWQNDLLIDAQDVGGAFSRSLCLQISSGRTWVKTRGVAKDI